MAASGSRPLVAAHHRRFGARSGRLRAPQRPRPPADTVPGVIRLGLCCTFRDAPIRFRRATATHALRLPPDERRAKLAALCDANATALHAAVAFCGAHGIGAFRVNSQVWPLATHPQAGFELAALPGGPGIAARYRAAGELARSLGVRLSLHPDQFVVLSSDREDVVASSLCELEYQATVAGLIGADVVNVHAGGAYGDKAAALDRFARAVDRLSADARSRLTVENDDRVYTPAELLPLARRTGLPLVYDVHHHRVLRDGLEVAEATALCAATWGGREPMVHLSSPLDGWGGKDPARHHDFVDLADFPECWRGLALTVDVEAKAKEVAVARLRAELLAAGVAVTATPAAAATTAAATAPPP